MRDNDFMEVPIFKWLDEGTTPTLYVHKKDEGLIVFIDLKSDPVFYEGWLTIQHQLFSRTMTSLVRTDDVQYLSYYSTPNEVKEDK
jgi:hypothetical protein